MLQGIEILITEFRIRPKSIWDVAATGAGTYRVVMHCVAREPGATLGVHGLGDFKVEVPASEKWRRDYKAIELGKVTLSKGQRLDVSLGVTV